jgi:hypothetical protein
MGTIRKGAVTLAAIVRPGLICAAMLIVSVTWFSHTSITIGGASARGAVSVTASGTSELRLAAVPDDPPWT